MVVTLKCISIPMPLDIPCIFASTHTGTNFIASSESASPLSLHTVTPPHPSPISLTSLTSLTQLTGEEESLR